MAACGLVLLLAPALQAQKKLTNREIWASPLFSAEMVGGLASMKDGLHYTALDQEGDEAVIKQYAYRTGEAVATLVRGSEQPVQSLGVTDGRSCGVAHEGFTG